MKSIIAISALILASFISSQAQTLEHAQTALVQANQKSSDAQEWAKKNVIEVIEAKKVWEKAHKDWSVAVDNHASNRQELYELQDQASKVYYKLLYAVPTVAEAKKELMNARDAVAQLAKNK